MPSKTVCHPLVYPSRQSGYRNIRQWWICPNCFYHFDFDIGEISSNDPHVHCVHCQILWLSPIKLTDLFKDQNLGIICRRDHETTPSVFTLCTKCWQRIWGIFENCPHDDCMAPWTNVNELSDYIQEHRIEIFGDFDEKTFY